MEPNRCHFRIEHRAKKGFTLVELMAVITIIAILASFIGFSMKPSMSMKFVGQVDTLASTLENSRQLAVTKNTFVWVLLGQSAQNPQDIDGLVIESTDGTDPILWNAVVDMTGSSAKVTQSSGEIIQDAPLRLSSKPLHLAGIFLANLTQPPANTPTDGINETDLLALQEVSEPTTFQVRIAGRIQTYIYALRFGPSGQVFAQTTAVKYIQIGIKPAQQGQSYNALLRVGGLTGRTEKYL